jgi:cellulose biosynthesis protein BcsQ
VTKIYTISNFKGGVGKTKLVRETGTALARRGKRVLAVDGDSDCCLTDSLFEEVTSKDLLDALTEPELGLERAMMHYTRVPLKGCFDVIAGSQFIRKAETAFTGRTHEEGVPRVYSAIYPWLFEKFARMYDYILIDPSPSWNENTDAFLNASHYAIVPMNPEPLAVKALRRVVKQIGQNNMDRALSGLTGQTRILAVAITKILDDQQEDAIKLAPKVEAAGLPLWRLGPQVGVRYTRTALEADGQLLPVWAIDPNDPCAQAHEAIADYIEKAA